MHAAGTTATIPPAFEAGRDGAEEHLPWLLAAPLIGGVSLGLWLGIWQLARLVLGAG